MYIHTYIYIYILQDNEYMQPGMLWSCPKDALVASALRFCSGSNRSKTGGNSAGPFASEQKEQNVYTRSSNLLHDYTDLHKFNCFSITGELKIYLNKYNISKLNHI